MKYMVIGGVWNPEFSEIIEEAESYGPYNTYEEAFSKWQERSWRTVDNCQTRFLIKTEGNAGF